MKRHDGAALTAAAPRQVHSLCAGAAASELVVAGAHGELRPGKVVNELENLIDGTWCLVNDVW